MPLPPNQINVPSNAPIEKWLVPDGSPPVHTDNREATFARAAGTPVSNESNVAITGSGAPLNRG